MDDTLRGMTRDQCEAIRGYLRGMDLLARQRHFDVAPLGYPPGASEEQIKGFAANREKSKLDVAAAIDDARKLPGVFGDGVRFALDGEG